MKECRYCSTLTAAKMKWTLGKVTFVSPFCSQECRSKYVDIKRKIEHQKKMDKIKKTTLPPGHEEKLLVIEKYLCN